MSLLGWCQWLEHTSLATAVSESVWLFPVIEAATFSPSRYPSHDPDVRPSASRSRFSTGLAARMMADVVRWSKFGFAIMFMTGMVLFMTQASKAYGNVFFRTKLLLLLILGINAAVYQLVLYPRMAQWDARGGAPLGARMCGALSLVGWIGVIICGRTMVYQF